MSNVSKPVIVLVDNTIEPKSPSVHALEEAGFEVVVVGRSKTALDRLREGGVEMVLSAVNLPDKSGFELCRLLKKDSQFERMPVIFLTASTEDLILKKCFEVGGADYVAKPIDVVELRARVESQHQLMVVRQEEQRLRRMLSVTLGTMTEVACCIDGEGRVLFANSAARKWFGAKVEDANYFELSKGNELVNAVGYVRDALDNGSYHAETVIGDGVMREVIANPVYDDTGDVTAMVITNADVKARVDHDEKVRVAQKEAALARLSGGALRELDAVLGGMVGYLALLRDQVEEDEQVASFFKAMINTNDQANEIVGRLLDFLSGQDQPPIPLDVNLELKRLKPYLDHSLSQGVQCRHDVPDDAVIVELGPMLFTVLVASMLYAADAEIGGNGSLVLSSQTEECAFTQRELATVSVRFTLSDTKDGEAWNSDADERMGLDLARYVVDLCDGRFAVDTESPDSVAFTATFPTLEKATEDPSITGNKILVVDDDPVIRQMLNDCFDIIGYEGIYAESGEDALVQIKARQPEIGMVILDMIMPGMSGDEVLAEIRRNNPRLPVVISSAHASAANKPSKMEEPDGWLDKPFKIIELKEIVERLIPGN